jgi:twitching motility two-component system response regulator PilH
VGFFNQLLSLFRKKNQPLPIEDEVEPQERRKRSRTNPREETRILVIDDSPTILTAMKRFLDSAHCTFLGALDAKMGLELALTQKPDLIFLDIVMPGINGFAALRALRKSSRTREIPIIMMSGNEQAKAQFFGAHIGADDFMKKPFSRFEVFARISRLLDADGIPRRPPLPGTTLLPEEPLSVQLMEIPTPAPEAASAAEKPDDADPVIELTDLKPVDVQPAAANPAEAQSVGVKPSDVKPADAKPSDAQAPAAKPAKSARPKASTQSRTPASETIAATPAAPEPEPAQQPTRAARRTKPVQAPAQIIPISQPPVQPAQPAVSPELLTQIAQLAPLAQSDPEALRALGVLAAQLATQLGTLPVEEAVNQPRAAKT